MTYINNLLKLTWLDFEIFNWTSFEYFFRLCLKISQLELKNVFEKNVIQNKTLMLRKKSRESDCEMFVKTIFDIFQLSFFKTKKSLICQKKVPYSIVYLFPPLHYNRFKKFYRFVYLTDFISPLITKLARVSAHLKKKFEYIYIAKL